MIMRGQAAEQVECNVLNATKQNSAKQPEKRADLLIKQDPFQSKQQNSELGI